MNSARQVILQRITVINPVGCGVAAKRTRQSSIRAMRSGFLGLKAFSLQHFPDFEFADEEFGVRRGCDWFG